MTIPIRFDLRPVPGLDFAAMTAAFGTGAFSVVEEGRSRAVYQVGETTVTLLGQEFHPAIGGGIAGTLEGFRIAEGGTVLATGSFDTLFFIGATVLEGMRNNWEEFDFTVSGTRRAETIAGLDGNDVLAGSGGADRLEGGDGSDRLEGGDGNDRLLGGDSIDTLLGGEGDDILNGGSGFDDLFGDAGNDLLWDGGDGGQLYGGTGFDRLRAGDGPGSFPVRAWGGAEADVFEVDRDAGRFVVKDFDALDTVSLFEAAPRGLATGGLPTLGDLYGPGPLSLVDPDSLREDLGLVLRESSAGDLVLVWGDTRVVLQGADRTTVELDQIRVTTGTLDFSLFE